MSLFHFCRRLQFALTSTTIAYGQKCWSAGTTAKKTAKIFFRRPQLSYRGWLEDKLQCKLNVSRLIDGAGDLAEWIADVIARRSEADHVERIEEVAAELEVSSFRDGEVLRQSKVNLLIARSALRADRRIAEARCTLFAVGA
jgi:hypothetical protein